MHFTLPIAGTLAAAFMLVAGLRGRRVTSAPHCRHCGYDLRGFADLVHGQCSECGSPFPQAVDRAQRKRNLQLVKSALIIFAVIWLGWGALSLLDFLGPAFVRIRSNDSLIRMFFDDSHSSGYAAGDELSRRISTGQFQPHDAQNAVNTIIARLQQGRSRQDFPRFLADASRVNAITPDQFAAIGHLISPDNPDETTFATGQVSPDLYGEASTLSLELHTHRDVFSFGFPYWMPRLQVTSLTLLDSATKNVIPLKVSNTWGFNDECGIYLNPATIPSGVYEARFSLNVLINPENSTKVLASWSKTEKHLVKVWPGPRLILFSRTSPPAIDMTSPDDPSIANKISVEFVPIHSDKGELRLAVYLFTKGIIPGLFARVIVNANGTDYFAGYMVVPADTSCGIATYAIAPSFPENVQSVDIVLKPDLEQARQWGDAPSVYGNPLTFHHVPIGIRQ